MAFSEDIKLVLLFSGKRKSGKDYCTELLKDQIGENKCTLIRISEPIKSHFASKYGLDLKELLCDGPYKELYRQKMILWSDEVRAKEPGYFCEAACLKAKVSPLWIITDCRRKTDIAWFKDKFGIKVKTVRLECSDDIRKQRGWVFTDGVDNVVSETNLDDYTEWDLVLKNEGEAVGNVVNNVIAEFDLLNIV